jgi:hypothetical protein
MCVPCTLSMGSATTYVATCSARVFVTPTRAMTGILIYITPLSWRGHKKVFKSRVADDRKPKENQPFGWHPFYIAISNTIEFKFTNFTQRHLG